MQEVTTKNHHCEEVVATNTSIMKKNRPPKSIELRQKEKKIERDEKKRNKKSRKKTKHNAQRFELCYLQAIKKTQQFPSLGPMEKKENRK